MSGAGKPGAVCPFCKGSISRDLERYGGNCPHCLLEVPGDDAPTDPGLEQQKKLEEEEAAKAEAAAKKRTNYMRIGAVLALLLVVFGGFEYQRQIEARSYIPPEYFQMPMEDLNIEDGVAEAPEPTTGNPPATAGNPPATAGNPPATQVAANNPPATGAKIPATDLGPPATGAKIPGTGEKPPKTGEKPPKNPTPTAVASNNTPPAPVIPTLGGTGGVGTGPVSASSGQVLTDKAAIEAMVTRISKGYNGAILSCYESATKANPELKGIWTVTFIVTPGGTTRDVKVTGSSAHDSTLEACIQRRVEGWRFQSISGDFKAAKTYRLSPSGW